MKINKPKPIERKVIASPENYEPSSKELEVIGAFNPGVTTIKTEKGGLETLLLIRVCESPLENKRKTYNSRPCLPFFEISLEIIKELKINYDNPSREDIIYEDFKAVKFKDYSVRMKHISLTRILKLGEDGNVIEREQKPLLNPAWEYERFGMEDFRITSFKGGKYLITYVCPHRDFGVSTALLITNDFKNFERPIKENTPRPIIAAIKDISIFPEKFPSPSKTESIKKDEELYAALIRPNAFADISRPGIWLSYSPDLVHWGQPHRLITSKKGEITGTGSPLIEINNIFLGAYHEINENSLGNKYETKLMSLNKKEIWKDCKTSEVLLTRKDYNDLLPEKGYVPNVVYTTGMIEKEGITKLFSGIDDTWTVMDKFYTEDLIKFLNKE